MVCSICGDVGATGTDPALPHTPETRVEVDATYCDEHGVRVTYVRVGETNWDEKDLTVRSMSGLQVLAILYGTGINRIL